MRSALLSLFLLFAQVIHAQESGVQLARKNAINATKQSILEECRQAANGDWSKWLASVKPYRDALTSICYSSWNNPNPSRLDPKLTYPLISWVDDPAQLLHTNVALGMIDIGDDIETYMRRRIDYCRLRSA
jgi:hypothetical protein